ncbi:hypothetical protein [Lacisediminihabitans sp.]|uniref:hypothetical protein n=1 Tax=Lacisediminihabitans sp. TaxID=2787631 RepID=UPI00374D096B
MASHLGRHSAPRTQRPTISLRRAAATGTAMVVALGLAATMAIPAVSASATDADAQVSSMIERSQHLTVSSTVETDDVVRDKSSV